MEEKFAKVIRIIDDYRVVINRGRVDGVAPGDRFLIYTIGEELFDPDTNGSLGKLEIVKGRGKATHIQEHITTIISTETERIIKRNNPQWFALGMEQEEFRDLPFNDPEVGDVARPLKKKA